MQLVPTGVIGEIYVGGIGVARGYLRRMSLNRERFSSNPFFGNSQIKDNRKSRFYRTGDMGRYTFDGNIEVIGRRIDNQVKIRGYRIELGEIEASLAKYPNISQCAVVVQDMSEQKSLVAY